MINKNNFDSTINLLIIRAGNDTDSQSINSTFHQDISHIIQTLTNIINVEQDSLIQLYIETENQNLELITKEFNNINPPLSKAQHTYFRGQLFNILTSIERSAQIFYTDRLSEEE